MAEDQQNQDDEQWEERSLNLLQGSEIDQQLSAEKSRTRSLKRHNKRWLSKPMAISALILELQDHESRESALRCVSNYLLTKWEEEPETYYWTGYLLYNSCCTMSILLQEILVYYRYMARGNLNDRSSMRVANVLTLFQCVAANLETRKRFVTSRIPNFLIPLIVHKSSLEVFENVRAVALSVIGILCQTREPQIIQWAIESNMVKACLVSIEIGSELSKVIGMHILEAILRDPSGLSYICDPRRGYLVGELMKTFNQMVNILSIRPDISPRLLFHVIRCYFLLCNHLRGYGMVLASLPDPMSDGSFDEVTEEFPVIGDLLHQLLLFIGKGLSGVSSDWGSASSITSLHRKKK